MSYVNFIKSQYESCSDASFHASTANHLPASSWWEKVRACEGSRLVEKIERSRGSLAPSSTNQLTANTDINVSSFQQN